MKAVLIMTFLVVAVALSGGWAYYATARQYLRDSDARHSLRTAEAICTVAAPHLAQHQIDQLQRLVNESAQNQGILYAAVLDAQGRTLAYAERPGPAKSSELVQSLSVSVSAVTQTSDETLVVAHPVVGTSAISGKTELRGAIRLVMDTRATAGSLANVQKTVMLLAAFIVLATMPLGYLMVWRLLVQPIRLLVSATRKLANGDFNARANLRRQDELGQLGRDFDSMAGELAAQRAALLSANESLERAVENRTRELKVANVRLRDEMTEKDDFLRAVSHDLNAPLRNIAGMTTMVARKYGPQLPQDVLGRLDRIQANIATETSLLNDLLELSHIRSQRQKSQLVDMGKLLADLAATFEYELRTRHIELRIATALPTLQAEANRLRQLFQNLIDNAIKYMNRPNGGLIELRYVRKDGRHVFSVVDNGPGIPPAEHLRIFCVFRRASQAAGSGVEGKGVGLAVVKTIASNYDGRVWVESREGQGAAFHVELDVFKTDPARIDINNQEPNEQSESDKPVQADCRLVG